MPDSVGDEAISVYRLCPTTDWRRLLVI